MINPFRKENSENDDEEYKNIHAGIEIGTEATRPDIIERARKHNLIKLSKTTYTITEDGIHICHLSQFTVIHPCYSTSARFFQ